MEPETEEQQIARIQAEVAVLWPRGFRMKGGNWIRDGIEYDFSAADLSQIDRIIDAGLFIVGAA